MAGLTNHARDKLLAELQSGNMRSGNATIKLGEAPDHSKWPGITGPCEGVVEDPSSGELWHIRLNPDTKRWEVVDD